MQKQFHTIFEMIDEAKKHNGLVTIPKRNGNTYQDKKDDLQSIFQYSWSSNYFCSGVFFGKAKTITPRIKSEINRLITKSDVRQHYLSVYDMFCIPKGKRTPESLQPFYDFFLKIKNVKEKDFSTIFSFMYENSPTRIEISINRKDDRDKTLKNCKEIEIEFNNFIQKNELIQIWLNNLAIDLKRVGRWSWFCVSEKSLFSIKEILAQLKKT